MQTSEAFSLIEKAIDTSHVPGGYLIVGEVQGNCMDLTRLILNKLYPGCEERIAERTHPDINYLEPEGKSGTIKIEVMRKAIIEPMAMKSFSGGWMVGVIAGADRMQDAAANAFLKSLEEPGEKTLFLLLTDRPDAICDTVISRCQRIDLSMPDQLLEGDERKVVEDVFALRDGMDGVFARAKAGRILCALLADLKRNAESSAYPLVRKSFFMTCLACVRRWIIESKVPFRFAMRNIEAVEEAFDRSCRYLPDEAVILYMMDKIVFPK